MRLSSYPVRTLAQAQVEPVLLLDKKRLLQSVGGHFAPQHDATGAPSGHARPSASPTPYPRPRSIDRTQASPDRLTKIASAIGADKPTAKP